MSEIRRNGRGHELAISVDESTLIDVRHPGQHDDFFLSIDQLNELVDRAPEIRRHVREAWAAIHGQRGGEQ